MVCKVSKMGQRQDQWSRTRACVQSGSGPLLIKKLKQTHANATDTNTQVDGWK